MADVTDSKSVELITRVGSSPTAGTKKGSFAKAELLFSSISFENPNVEIEKWEVKIRIEYTSPRIVGAGRSHSTFHFPLFTFLPYASMAESIDNSISGTPAASPYGLR